MSVFSDHRNAARRVPPPRSMSSLVSSLSARACPALSRARLLAGAPAGRTAPRGRILLPIALGDQPLNSAARSLSDADTGSGGLMVSRSPAVSATGLPLFVLGAPGAPRLLGCPQYENPPRPRLLRIRDACWKPTASIPSTKPAWPSRAGTSIRPRMNRRFSRDAAGIPSVALAGFRRRGWRGDSRPAGLYPGAIRAAARRPGPRTSTPCTFESGKATPRPTGLTSRSRARSSAGFLDPCFLGSCFPCIASRPCSGNRPSLDDYDAVGADAFRSDGTGDRAWSVPNHGRATIL